MIFLRPRFRITRLNEVIVSHVHGSQVVARLWRSGKGWAWKSWDGSAEGWGERREEAYDQIKKEIEE